MSDTIISQTFYCDCYDITHALRITPSYDDAGRLENVFVTVESHPEGLRERLTAALRALFGREANVAEIVLAGNQMHAFIAHCGSIRASSGMGELVTYTSG